MLVGRQAEEAEPGCGAATQILATLTDATGVYLAIIGAWTPSTSCAAG